mmetsp:Transcript_51939/g.148942  ORF Transcript_51939/g.148942 Transcript_51939/m.148942 type:complete len:210 (-) Transcript_51939:18-647(-)
MGGLIGCEAVAAGGGAGTRMSTDFTHGNFSTAPRAMSWKVATSNLTVTAAVSRLTSTAETKPAVTMSMFRPLSLTCRNACRTSCSWLSLPSASAASARLKTLLRGFTPGCVPRAAHPACCQPRARTAAVAAAAARPIAKPPPAARRLGAVDQASWLGLKPRSWRPRAAEEAAGGRDTIGCGPTAHGESNVIPAALAAPYSVVRLGPNRS